MTYLIKTARFIFFTASIATAGTIQLLPAQAANNLQCNAPFNQKVLTSTAVRCQKKSSNFSTKSAARNAANNWLSSAACNGHQSKPRKTIWRKSNGKWVAKVKFICANIT